MPTCPACGSTHVRKSRSHNARERWGRLVFVWFRCRRCSAAFRRVSWRHAGAVAAVAALGGASLWALSPTAVPPERGAADVPGAEAGAGAPGGLPGVGAVALPEAALKEAAAQGDQEARCRLGLALLQDYRVGGRQGSLNEAVRWLTLAAEAGDARAQLQLGIMHHEGSGLIEDFAEAARWFRQAALRGSSEAMLRLGGMALEGEGAPKDLVEAYVWLNLAAARGERAAEDARDRVRGLLDDGQLARAQERSRALDREVPRR